MPNPKDTKGEIDCRSTDEITCPYCGHEEGDSWEASDDDDARECQNEECGKKFAYESEARRYFTSWKVDCLNTGVHNWQPVKYMDSYPDAVQCKMCGFTHWKGLPK